MRRSHYIGLFIAMLICHLVSAQTAGLEFTYGASTVQMTEMKSIQEEYAKKFVQSGATVSTQSNFPSCSTWGGTFVVGIGKFETGVDYRHFSTEGSLTGTTSTSSPYTFNHDLTGNAFGIFGKYPLIYKQKFQLKLGTVAGLYASTADVIVSDNTGSQVAKLISKSFMLTPFIEPVYYIKKWCYAGLRGNYSYDFAGALHDRKDNKNKYVNDNGEPVHTNWSGLRAEVFIGFRMNNE